MNTTMTLITLAVLTLAACSAPSGGAEISPECLAVAEHFANLFVDRRQEQIDAIADPDERARMQATFDAQRAVFHASHVESLSLNCEGYRLEPDGTLFPLAGGPWTDEQRDCILAAATLSDTVGCL